MHQRALKLAAVAMALMAAGCLGGGGPGDGKTIEFTHGVFYAAMSNDKDFTIPVALGATMPIGVTANVGSGLLPFEYVNATLDVKGPDGASVPVTSTSTGKFEVVFPTTGEFTVSATTAQAQAELKVRVAELDLLVLVAPQLHTEIEGQAGCSAPFVVGPTLTLRANQRLSVALGGRSSAGEPMLGVFGVDVLDVGVDVGKPLLFARANSYTVSPRGTGPGELRFTERTTGKSVTQPLERDAAMATCP